MQKDKFMNEEFNKTGKILGIDFGQSKVGLATADFETKMAFAFETIPNDSHIFTKIKEICQNEEVGKIIIGSPSHKMSQAGAENAKIFGRRIGRETGIPVEYEEEMFTTKMAQSNLSESGAKGISKKDDAEAARIILQSWLDNNAS